MVDSELDREGLGSTSAYICASLIAANVTRMSLCNLLLPVVCHSRASALVQYFNLSFSLIDWLYEIYLGLQLKVYANDRGDYEDREAVRWDDTE